MTIKNARGRRVTFLLDAVDVLEETDATPQLKALGGRIDKVVVDAMTTARARRTRETNEQQSPTITSS
jgi:hypothetical protein